MAFTVSAKGAANSNSTVLSSQTFTTGRTILVGTIGAAGGDAVTGISDPAGNSYFSRPQTINNTSPGQEVWMAENITGFTGQITVSWSASGDHAALALEYDDPSARGGVSNMTPGSGADASASITPSAAVGCTYVGFVGYNNNNSFSGANLRDQQAGTAVSIGGYDSTTTTISSTHATGTNRVSIIELIPNAIQGGNVWTSGGTETAAQYWTNFRAGVSFTTGGNSQGYRLCVIKAMYDGIGASESVRAALYSNEADPNKVRRADSGAVSMGTNAGTNTRNMVAAPLSFTMQPNTTYWPTMNSNTGGTNWQDGSTPVRFTVETFASGPPDPWGNPDAASPDNTGGYFWATYQAIGGSHKLLKMGVK